MNTPPQPWHQLAASQAGRRALILAKGPSLDLWLAAGRPHEEGALVIAINEAACVGAQYGLSNHHNLPHAHEHPVQWVVSLPTGKKDFTPPSWRLPPWASHWFLHVHGRELLAQTREQIAESRLLYNQSSSAQPAVHFAWYLGCTSLLFVGLDGGHTPAHSQTVAARCPRMPPPGAPAHRSPAEHYALMAAHTTTAAETLFSTAWSHWAP